MVRFVTVNAREKRNGVVGKATQSLNRERGQYRLADCVKQNHIERILSRQVENLSNMPIEGGLGIRSLVTVFLEFAIQRAGTDTQDPSRFFSVTTG